MKKPFKQWLAESAEQDSYSRLVSTLFRARDLAHKLHLATKSFSQHEALGELYEILVEGADEIAEMCQGKFGPLTIDASTGDNIEPTNERQFVSDLVTWLDGTGKILVGSNDVLLNKYQEIVGKVYQIKYKMDNLS